MQTPRTLSAFEVVRLVRGTPPNPAGRIALGRVKLSNAGGAHKVDLSQLDLDMSRCDFHGTILTLDNLKQLKKMRRQNHAPMDGNRIDIRGATIDFNRKMVKSTASLDFDNSFSFEPNGSINALRELLGLPLAQAEEQPDIAPAPLIPQHVPAAIIIPPPPPIPAPQAVNPDPAENNEAIVDPQPAKRIRRGG